jgi:hypothetical protein
VDSREDPIDYAAMLVNRAKFQVSLAKLRQKLKKCGGDKSYMEFLVAKRKMALLANDLLMASTERIGSIRKLVCETNIHFKGRNEGQ